MFTTIKKQMQESFAKLVKDQSVLFITDCDRDVLWNTYLDGFPDAGIKQEHNCNCCRSFIKNYGNVVAIVDGKLVSIWNFEPRDDSFDKSIKDLNELVINSTIRDIFITNEKKVGTDSNVKLVPGADPIVWNHFSLIMPNFAVNSSSASNEALMGNARDTKNVFKRSLDELTLDSIETVLELIAQGSLYRGDEFKGVLTEFLKQKKAYAKSTDKATYCWLNSPKLGAVAKIRNTSIGTLLIDLSEGRDLDVAVTAFERVVAPTNYKRPTALVTKGMIEQAEKTINELGYANSLGRRYATPDDIAVSNLLYVNRDAKKATGVFAEMKEDVKINPKSLSKVEEITIDDFLKNVLPTVKGVQLLLENNHLNNLTSIITAKDKEAPILFKWANPFSWSYTNAVTDSMREKVVAAGGRVDGVFRFTHSWNELEPNQSLMDLHVFMPGCKVPISGGGPSVTGRRVGWNHRNDSLSGGKQDVDYTNAAPAGYIPIENITFPDIKRMPEGVYTCKIHNWSFRGTGGRGKAEIEFGGQVFQYEYPKTRNHEWVTIAEVTLKDGMFTIDHKLPTSSSSRDKWNLSTNKFHKVSMIMNSPNHWEAPIGNKHTFFILEGAKSDETPRGIFNEFLKEELTKDRKVFEILGGKLKVEPTDKQLSGVGFSSTQRNSVVCKVEGKFERMLKINF